MSDSDVTETAGDKVSALFEERRFRDAIEPAAEACRLEPERSGVWWNTLPEDVDGAIEDWTESLVMLCAQCSLGEPHDHHDDKKEGWSAERRFGLALRDESELRRLRRLGMWWRRGVRDVTRAL